MLQRILLSSFVDVGNTMPSGKLLRDPNNNHRVRQWNLLPRIINRANPLSRW
jgi:hypothetical protein